MKKLLLVKGLILLSAVGIIAVAYAFIGSMSPTERAQANAEHVHDISGLKSGEVLRLKVRGRPLFIYRPTSQDWSDLELLNPFVWNSTYSGFDKDNKLFVYWGISTRFGCELKIIKKGVPRPFSWDGEWLGGYFDPCHDSSYDFAGRTIREYKYTRNGFNTDVPNLKAPEYEIKDNRIILDLF